MQRFKILITSVLLIITLFVLAIGGNHDVSGSESKPTVVLDKPIQNALEREAAELANRQRKALQKSLNTYFLNAISRGDIVGAGVSIVKGDEILYSDGFGKRNSDEADGVDGETIFRLGSLSKGFTGVLAANIKHDGKVNWDDKVTDYIPGFQLGNKENTSRITLAHLLSHSSGAPYHSYTNLVEAGLSVSEIAEQFNKVEPISEPGAMYSYQNALFALSGEILCKASGEEVAVSLENRLFNPLEMCSTNMDHESLMLEDNVALPHYRRGRSWKPRKLVDNYYNAIPAGGINASAADMARWMRFLLGYNPEVMDRSAIAEAFKPVIEIPGRSKYYQRWPGHISSHYAFGWRIHKFQEEGSKDEKTIWHHGGSVNNFRNEIAIFPEADLGICVLLNSNSKISRNLIPDLYRIVEEVYQTGESALALNHGTVAVHKK
ncbi:serine hydrolase domain-containing protein [Robiginitalea aurantiaca]|uniref:Serine hydrolase domain-containing protein n=1 Tax=Robiginitalea aurantiaca TaxID=3056915 RepID=A0ABT7WFL8_9FLAO|nr:serine hydrolase domain-containing protein [Robiginitalea aurantiaca]MDM9631614.1 serine hydrolase domain-containing protein [Robiginitalea aurantiaca]